MDPVYLDHAATTPLHPEVLGAMIPHLGERFGNASSLHARGREARHAIEEARTAIARALDMDAAGVWFTGGGTEANNTAVRGVAARRTGPVVTGATEHESVLRAVDRLREEGRGTVTLPPGSDGVVNAEAVVAVLDRSPALVTLMRVNNETGAVTELRGISTECRERGVPVHTDAVQAAAWERVSPEALGVDLVTVSGHKLGGPVGVGALLVRPGTDCEPLLVGGSQEQGRRAGTENVAAIVGFARAVQLCASTASEEKSRLRTLKLQLSDGLRKALGDAIAFTTPIHAAPHILHCTFPERDGKRVDGEMLILRLDMDGVQASAGSACSSGTMEPSHVLLAMGYSRREASSALRLSLGRTTTARDIERAIPVIANAVRQVTA